MDSASEQKEPLLKPEVVKLKQKFRLFGENNLPNKVRLADLPNKKVIDFSVVLWFADLSEEAINIIDTEEKDSGEGGAIRLRSEYSGDKDSVLKRLRLQVFSSSGTYEGRIDLNKEGLRIWKFFSLQELQTAHGDEQKMYELMVNSNSDQLGKLEGRFTLAPERPSIKEDYFESMNNL